MKTYHQLFEAKVQIEVDIDDGEVVPTYILVPFSEKKSLQAFAYWCMETDNAETPDGDFGGYEDPDSFADALIKGKKDKMLEKFFSYSGLGAMTPKGIIFNINSSQMNDTYDSFRDMLKGDELGWMLGVKPNNVEIAWNSDDDSQEDLTDWDKVSKKIKPSKGILDKLWRSNSKHVRGG